MRRLKDPKSKEILPRFEVSVEPCFTKFFWNDCHWCDYEFRKEHGYRITFEENYTIPRKHEEYYVCGKCSQLINGKDIEGIFKRSNEFKWFQRKCGFDE